MALEPPERCAECGAPLASAQRYCLECGARAGAPSRQLAALLERLRAPARPSATAAGELAATPHATRPGAGARGPRLPPARVAALLVLVFLGFGVILGAAAGSRVQDTLAASVRPRLKLVLPAPAPAASPATTAASGGEAGTAVTEAPAAESEATPAPAASAPARTPTAKAPAPSKEPTSAAEQPAEGSSGAPASKLPPIKHVFVIMLSDQPYAATFGPISVAHYLSSTLEHRGTLLIRYDAVAHEQLANEIALLSGQGPTAETAANCPMYTSLAATGIGADEQVLGGGCVYPPATQTLPGQLAAKHLKWRAYIEGAGEAAGPSACAHPALGAADPSANQAASGGPYATFRNPFVYFDSIVSSPACATEDTGLAQLKGDLAAPARTPNLTYIVPDRCHDANPTPCTPGASAGLAPADSFLKQVVPEIMASAAYKRNGLLVISVDEAPSSGEFADSSSCCGQPSFPNVPPASSASGLSPRGGGTVGALLLSPYLKGAVTSQEPYNDFSLLRTIEDLFGVKHLGYAALPAVKPLEPAMFSSRKLG